MDTNRYFQWQNPALVKTIYPLREMKLRDFLYYYQEIDLWKIYKLKTIEDLADEVRAYEQAEARSAREAVARFKRLQDYFLTPDVRSDYEARHQDLDETELRKINLIHASFVKYFPNLNHPRKEKYFITQQVLLYEPRRSELEKQLNLLQRRYNAILPNHPSRPGVLAQLEKLRDAAIPMAENEYRMLRDFLSAFVALEPRKMEIARKRESARTVERSLSQRLQYTRSRLNPLENSRKAAAEEIGRLKNPPQLAPLETYFFSENVTNELQTAFPGIGDDPVKKINDLHRELATSFRYTRSILPRLQAIKSYVYRMEQAQRAVDRDIKQLETSLRNMGPTWKYREQYETNAEALRKGLPALDEEIRRLNDYWAAMKATTIQSSERDRLVQEKEAEISKLDTQIGKLVDETRDLETRLKDAENVLNIPESTYLLSVPRSKPLTVKDILRGKLQDYRDALDKKDQAALLEEIVARFKAEPNRYPLWLQYMVIHFSGMRYQSAHGSWADPRVLLTNLRTLAAEKEYNSLSDEAKDAVLQQKLLFYAPAAGQPQTEKLAAVIAPLLKADSEKWQAKVALHVKKLKSTSAYHRHKALFELMMDEANYSVEVLSGDEVLQTLEGMKDDLPGWMWKEIVRVTSLRTKYVDDDEWETLNAQEQAEKADYRWWEYRQMIGKWREAGTTAWRDEHDQSNRLIVTRAVCNETAEHIQHIRGNSPPGGLAARPKWYQDLESAGPKKPLKTGEKKPHFIIPRQPEDFTPGASILWLTFVDREPHAWSIARPLTLKSGEGLLPGALFRQGGQGADWTYRMSGNTITRHRNLYDEKKRKTGEQQQFLRWNHEATVIEVAETADGPVLLTFETARPNDDRRLSSVGVFKHFVNNVTYKISDSWFNATFVGYTPEEDVPLEDLKFMLDWEKILRK